jgi:creatinine amidohydrolase/Fe(II)-dependent formamide hydrolase-like protein
MKPPGLPFALAVLVLRCGSAAAQTPAKIEGFTHPAIQQRPLRVWILPMVSTGPHACHLCYGNDAFTAGSLAARAVTFVRPWEHVGDNTSVGDPTRATAEKGRKLVEVFVDRIASFLKELSGAELTDAFPY